MVSDQPGVKLSKRHEREERILERLTLENKELKQINRSLLKQVKKLSRGYRKFMAEDDESEKDAVECAKEIAKKMCWDCSEGEFKKIEIAGRYFRLCNVCGKRGKTKYVEK